MSSSPMMTVIVPVYQTPQNKLIRCLQPFISHYDTNFELIVVDDGSDCDCAYYIKELVNSCQVSAKYIRTENGGQNSARNLGISHANGLYVQFLDSDDELIWDNELLLLDILQNRHPEILRVGHVVGDADISDLFTYSAIDVRTLSKEYAIISSAELWRQVFLKERLVSISDKPLMEGVRIGEDLASVVPCLIKSNNILETDLPVYRYYVDDTGIMRSSPAKQYLDLIAVIDYITSSLLKSELRKYHAEIEWLAIYHILFVAVTQVVRAGGPRSRLLNMLSDYVQLHFPEWKKNPYLNHVEGFDAGAESRSIQFKLIMNHHYRLFLLLRSLKRMLRR